MAECAVTFLVHQLSTWLKDGQNIFEAIQEDIVYIKDAFERMRAFSRVADAKEEEDAELQVWIKQVQVLAYDVQDILEKHVVMCTNFQEKGSSWPLKKWKKSHHPSSSDKLSEAHDNLSMMLEGIKVRIIAISEGHNTFLLKYGVTISAESSNIISWCNNREEVILDDDADLVGIENHKSVLLDWLLSDDEEKKLLCVVGTRGIGKTTLVKKVYDEAAAKKQFNPTVWLDVPTHCSLEVLLKSVLYAMFELDYQSRQVVETMDAHALLIFIYEAIEPLRYFVVLDDVPSITTWDVLRTLFPNGDCGSRIIITSCSAEMCHTICTGDPGHVYRLKPLSEEDSWILFCRKTFSGSVLCPPSLRQISKDIIEICNGLPLAILVIAGALATKGNRIEAWEMFHASLVDKLQGSNDVEHMERLLKLCYQDLPFYLKSCFTYLSIIPKKHVINKMRLLRLWAAEGFVLEIEGKAIAQVAESYLNELANRGLIKVAERYHDGRLGLFRIPNLWYETILYNSREWVIATTAHEEETRRPQDKVRRLLIHELDNDTQEMDQFKHLNSIIAFGFSHSLSNSFLSKLLGGGFKLLKVLDLQGAPLVNIPEEVFELFHLKFLNLKSTKINYLPGSVKKLQNLEFLDLRDTLVTKLPDETLKLQRLRHVLIHHRVDGILQGFEAPKKIGRLLSLEMVNLIQANTSILAELGKLTRLRMLYIANLRNKHGRDLCSSLDKLINLQQLSISSYELTDTIDLHYRLSSTFSCLRTLILEGPLEKFPQWVTSLHALTTVSLLLSKLLDSALEALQDLPNLVRLVLDRAYEGEELRFRAGGFKKLNSLCIWNSLELRQIKVEEGALASLEELQLTNCGLMKELPFGIEHLSKLQCLLLEGISEKLSMTALSKDNQSGDYWKIAHIPQVLVVD